MAHSSLTSTIPSRITVPILHQTANLLESSSLAVLSHDVGNPSMPQTTETCCIMLKFQYSIVANHGNYCINYAFAVFLTALICISCQQSQKTPDYRNILYNEIAVQYCSKLQYYTVSQGINDTTTCDVWGVSIQIWYQARLSF